VSLPSAYLAHILRYSAFGCEKFSPLDPRFLFAEFVLGTCLRFFFSGPYFASQISPAIKGTAATDGSE